MTRPPLSINRERLVQIFFFGAFGLLLYQLFILTRPFMPGLLGAGMLAMGFYPLYSWTKRRVKKSNLAATLLTFFVLCIVVVPLIFTGVIIIHEAERLMPTFQAQMGAVKSGDFQSFTDKLPSSVNNPFQSFIKHLNNLGIDYEPIILGHIRAIGTGLASMGKLTFQRLIIWTLNVLVLLVSLFFAFRDGEALLQWVLSLIPMQADHKKAIARRAYDTFRAVAIGVSVTAAAQGFTAMVGFWIAGVKLPVLLGLATTITSFLGASWVVTLPVTLSIWSESSGRGIFLLIWSLLVVGVLDNILKPLLIGPKARMSFFLILFSIIGGVKAYGFLGFILGPVLVASILTFIKIYREEYGQHQ